MFLLLFAVRINMAGLQSFIKSTPLLRNSHMIFKNVLVKQSSRTNHILSSGLFPLKNRNYIKKVKVIYSTHLQNAYRLSSTSNELSGILESSSKPKPSVEMSQVMQPHDAEITDPALSSTDITDKATNLNTDDIITESMLPPMPAEPSSNLADLLNTALREPTLTDLGLCSWWPTGRVQKILEILYSDLNLPWWESVSIVAFALRILTLPINIIIKKKANHLQNHMPQIQEFQKRMQDANITGNYYEAAKAYQDSMDYMKEHDIKMTRQLYPMFVQSTIFISMFWALRSMATLPVESLKTGGLWWFTDLTLADPYYILPAVVSGTVCLVLKSGIDGNVLTTRGKFLSRLFMLGIPFIIFPFIMFSPSVIQIYWVMSNFLILLFTALIKIQAVSKFFKIPPLIEHNYPTPKNTKKQKFLEEIKEHLSNYRMHKAIMERDQLSAMNFQKAGKAPVQRTFNRDPTKKKIHTTKS